MPVPAPRHLKPLSHPVIKQPTRGDGQVNPFQILTHTLPVPPAGPPPSLGTREQWIDSLPTWRRIKPRRVWEDDTQHIDERAEQDFSRGLTAAGNASVIKGAHAEASIPPISTLFESGGLPTEMTSNMPSRSGSDADDDMISDYLTIDQTYLEDQIQWNDTSSIAIDDDDATKIATQAQRMDSATLLSNLVSYDHQTCGRSASTPVLIEQSPSPASGLEGDSSPLQPVTPFGLYVDRAVTSHTATNGIQSQTYNYQDEICSSRCYPDEPAYQHAVEPAQEHVFTSSSQAVPPSASIVYKKLAEPLSDWVANYVWKVCTTGLSLPSMFARPSHRQIVAYSAMPPSYLAASVHSLFLSTLLQPSAIFLALWYIVRLPVYFPAGPLGEEHVKEERFRAALLGDCCLDSDREAMETSAPFRLVVLGCMLANKWLDDHTFSNKTWHNISNVPIQVLNKLESLTLDVFEYDLTVSAHDWSQWLTYITSYHASLTSPMHTQPISRPSTNPHAIVRKAMDEIVNVPAVHHLSSVPQPAFVGLEERKREKLEKERAMVTDVLEINLDEDGPLREEYLPKRRISGAGSHINPHITQSFDITHNGGGNLPDWDQNSARDHRILPPPARWSPAGDEPIYPEKSRVSGRYAAVQPPLVHPTVPYPVPYHHPPADVYSHYNWNSVLYPVKSQPNYPPFEFPTIDSVSNQTPFGTYYIPQIPTSHSRSLSLSHDQENLYSRQHARSYSQTPFEYQCSDIRITANEHNQGPAMWRGANHYQYGSALAPIHNVFAYQPTWLRT